MAHDSQRGRTVLFGGEGTSVAFADTWEWNGLVWSQVASTGPSYRRGHAMVYDSSRGRVVLFGGQGSSVFGDTWEWDGATWTLVAIGGPSPRDLVAMAFDSGRGRTVLFGGLSGSSCLSDTWEWSGVSWTPVASGPPGRIRHAMAYDSARGRTVLFGGDQLTVSSELGDTWEWNGASWSHATSTGPAPRTTHALTYDSIGHRCILFGGEGGSGPTFTPYGDTWAWDGVSWIQVAASGPAARTHSAMAFDSQRGQPVLFGGQVFTGTAATKVGDTWVFGSWPPSPSAAASAFGTGCGSSAIALSPDAAAPPAVGSTARALVSHVPSPLAFVALGWSNVSAGPFLLPVPLDGYGMIGCYMLQSTEVVGQPVTPTGPSTASYSLAIPMWSNLLGIHLYLQAWAVAPGMNPANVIVSNGVDWLIGY